MSRTLHAVHFANFHGDAGERFVGIALEFRGDEGTLRHAVLLKHGAGWHEISGALLKLLDAVTMEDGVEGEGTLTGAECNRADYPQVREIAATERISGRPEQDAAYQQGVADTLMKLNSPDGLVVPFASESGTVLKRYRLMEAEETAAVGGS